MELIKAGLLNILCTKGSINYYSLISKEIWQLSYLLIGFLGICHKGNEVKVNKGMCTRLDFISTVDSRKWATNKMVTI